MAGMYPEIVQAAVVGLPRIDDSWWRQVHHVIPIGFVGAISWSV